MKRGHNAIRCDVCNLFMSNADLVDAYSWVYFGGPLDLEPGDPVFAHAECWDDLPLEKKMLTRRVCYIPPGQVQKETSS